MVINNGTNIQPSMQQSFLFTLHVSTTMGHLQVFSVTYSSPPTTRRATVKIFDPASTRVTALHLLTVLLITSRHELQRKRRSSVTVSIVAYAAIGADCAGNTAFQPVHWCVLGT
jgi:hypothetical protein